MIPWSVVHYQWKVVYSASKTDEYHQNMSVCWPYTKVLPKTWPLSLYSMESNKCDKPAFDLARRQRSGYHPFAYMFLYCTYLPPCDIQEENHSKE